MEGDVGGGGGDYAFLLRGHLLHPGKSAVVGGARRPGTGRPTAEGRDPLDDFRIINEELEKYGEPIGRPQLVVLNKCDLIYDSEQIEELKAKFKKMGYKVFAVSAAMNKGFEPLLNEIVRELP